MISRHLTEVTLDYVFLVPENEGNGRRKLRYTWFIVFHDIHLLPFLDCLLCRAHTHLFAQRLFLCDSQTRVPAREEVFDLLSNTLPPLPLGRNAQSLPRATSRRVARSSGPIQASVVVSAACPELFAPHVIKRLRFDQASAQQIAQPVFDDQCTYKWDERNRHPIASIL